jgi:hypothetical protein
LREYGVVAKNIRFYFAISVSTISLTQGIHQKRVDSASSLNTMRVAENAQFRYAFSPTTSLLLAAVTKKVHFHSAFSPKTHKTSEMVQLRRKRRVKQCVFSDSAKLSCALWRKR